MIAMVALCSASANAQLLLGGEAGYVNSGSDMGNYDQSSTTFTVAPELVFGINDNWAIGFNLGYTQGKNETEGKDYSTTTYKYNKLSFNPFARFTFAETGDIKWFIDGGLYYAKTDYLSYDKDETTFGVLFRPGVAYEITDNITLDAHLGQLSYYNVSNVGGVNDIDGHNFTMRASNAISFGLFFKF